MSGVSDIGWAGGTRAAGWSPGILTEGGGEGIRASDGAGGIRVRGGCDPQGTASRAGAAESSPLDVPLGFSGDVRVPVAVPVAIVPLARGSWRLGRDRKSVVEGRSG